MDTQHPAIKRTCRQDCPIFTTPCTQTFLRWLEKSLPAVSKNRFLVFINRYRSKQATGCGWVRGGKKRGWGNTVQGVRSSGVRLKIYFKAQGPRNLRNLGDIILLSGALRVPEWIRRMWLDLSKNRYWVEAPVQFLKSVCHRLEFGDNVPLSIVHIGTKIQLTGPF